MVRKDIDGKWTGRSGLDVVDSERGLLVEFCRQDDERLYHICL
jgi:hypothetical protein